LEAVFLFTLKIETIVEPISEFFLNKCIETPYYTAIVWGYQC